MRVWSAGWLLCLFLGAVCVPAKAQTGSPRSDWKTVEALAPGTAVRVRSSRGKVHCRITAVTEDQLTCSQVSYPRPEIESIKLERKSRSAGVGALIGGGVGAGIGAAIGTAVKRSFFVSSSGKAAGVGAAIFGVVGIGVGALIGNATDFAGKVVYRR